MVSLVSRSSIALPGPPALLLSQGESEWGQAHGWIVKAAACLAALGRQTEQPAVAGEDPSALSVSTALGMSVRSGLGALPAGRTTTQGRKCESPSGALRCRVQFAPVCAISSARVSLALAAGEPCSASGGIDSPWSVIWPRKRSGLKRLAVTMPYATSSRPPGRRPGGSQATAQRQHLEITPIVEPCSRPSRHGPASQGQRHGPHPHDRALRPERGVGGLVLGTGTRPSYPWLLHPYGDSACALLPSATCTRRRSGSWPRPWRAPVHPGQATADLGPIRPTKSLGLTYDEADAILYLLFDAGFASPGAGTRRRTLDCSRL